MNNNVSNIKVFNLYNAIQHIIFSIKFLENIINSIIDEKEISVYRSLIGNLQYLADKTCDLLEIEVQQGSGSVDLSNYNTVTEDYVSDSRTEDIPDEIRNYIKQIKEEIIREKEQLVDE